MPPEAFFLVPIAGMATGTIFMFGIYKLITRWMEYRHRRDLPGPAEELQELRGRVAELETCTAGWASSKSGWTSPNGCWPRPAASGLNSVPGVRRMHELWGSPLAPLIFVAFFVSVGGLLLPVMRGLQRRIEGGGGADLERLREEVRLLQAEVAHLRSGAVDEAVHERLVDLEERVDFAERLLPRRSSAGSQGGA